MRGEVVESGPCLSSARALNRALSSKLSSYLPSLLPLTCPAHQQLQQLVRARKFILITYAGKAAPAAIMSAPPKYMLVSLPTSISATNDKEDALNALKSTVSADNVNVIPFKIPEFKIGTLDALVQQADDLAKLESACDGVVAKIGDGLRTLLEGDEDKIAQQKTVNDSMFKSTSWSAENLITDFPLQSLLINICGPSTGTRSNIVPINHWQS